ncbi:transporter substrate-binding domain-containing protein [Thiomicrorhabdus sediminis]|uniref:Transporter substrate-binding domain-containing protein n=1 Tax=Thiomicrorhabdus sediminis TaxID=2580412 RepID=A0A4P9K9M4_9GAMM|nr:transporter substrate-binding domain-containing protein [Thiomicrorhabdus sediminis]
MYQPFKGDLADIRERRILRVLVSYNKTNFFHTKRGNRGIEHDLIKAYEKYLNRGPRKTRYKTHIVFLARPFEKLLPDLLAGNGDMVASGLTITPERQSFIDFTEPYIENVDEILVSNNENPAPTKLEELAGKQVIVVANSSYIIHLEKANQSLGLLGLAPIEIVKADSLLEAEDLLEMVNAGLFDYTVVDNHIAEIYSKIFKNLRLQNEFVFHHGGKIGWALNKNLPDLKESLNHFINDYARPGKLLGNSLYKKYFKNPFWIKQPLSLNALTETPCLQYYFEKYAIFFDFDWYLIASQAYQESGFKQNLRSSANAVGIMQIKPSTAASKIVNIPNISKMENNILAGVKYLAFIRDYYFDKPEYSNEDKINFSLAAYNAGPGRIRKLQRLAESKGLDPHKWHYNVEVIARQEIGHETVDYVTKIQKTKIALKLAKELAEKKHWLKNQRIEEFQEAEQEKSEAPTNQESPAKTFMQAVDKP